MDGGQYVLNPSNRRKTLIGNSISGKISNNELIEMQKQSDRVPIPVSQIKFGRSYYITDTLGNKVQLVYVDDYPDLKSLRNAIINGQRVVEAHIDTEGKAIDRDLATYECNFTSIDGTEYSLW